MACIANPDVWLTAEDNTNSPPGNEASPLSASTVARLNDILETNHDCTIHYAEGTYQTQGYLYGSRQTANPNCHHIGAGVGQTIIRLVELETGTLGCIFGAVDVANPAFKIPNGFSVQDMTLDCNAVSNAPNRCQGVSAAGSNITLSNLNIIGFSTGDAGETWGALLGPGPTEYLTEFHQTNFDNVIVTGCSFTSPAPTNGPWQVNCCSLVCMPGFTGTNNAILSCTASNIASPGTLISSGFYAPLVAGCTVDGCEKGTYFETGNNDEAHKDYILRNNTYRHVNSGVFLQFVGTDIRSISMISNTFELNCGGSAFWSSTAGGSPDARLYWFVARGNTITTADPSCNDSNELGLQVFNLNHALVESNTITLNSGLGLPRCNPPVSRWFLGNTDANGQPLSVAWNTGTAWVDLTQAADSAWLDPVPQLINIDIGAGLSSSAKSGTNAMAATGVATNDFWNYYTRDDGHGGWKQSASLTNLLFASRAISTAGLTISNLAGAWNDASTDPMYKTYDYPNLSWLGYTNSAWLTVTNLSPGLYNFYLYSPDGNFRLTVDSTDYGSKTCQDTIGTNPPAWREGLQYAVFRDVVVSTNQAATITVSEGVSKYAIISGLQIEPVPLPAAVPFLNVDFGAGLTSSPKTGMAAATNGASTNDFWNYYDRDDGHGGYKYSDSLAGLRLANGWPSTVGLTLANLPGSYTDGSTDPMYNVYDYSFSGNATLTVTNLPPAVYSFYLYSPKGKFQLNCGAKNYGTKTTADTVSNPPVWRSGVQYALFSNVIVTNQSQAVVITVTTGSTAPPNISGMQIQHQ